MKSGDMKMTHNHQVTSNRNCNWAFGISNFRSLVSGNWPAYSPLKTIVTNCLECFVPVKTF